MAAKTKTVCEQNTEYRYVKLQVWLSLFRHWTHYLSVHYSRAPQEVHLFQALRAILCPQEILDYQDDLAIRGILSPLGSLVRLC